MSTCTLRPNRDWTVPVDFPRSSANYSIAGTQPKVALVEYEGKYYEPGCTPPELWETWTICEDLAHQFARKCLETKAGKRSAMSEPDILNQYYDRTLRLGWGTDEEIAWVFHRVAALLDWPEPPAVAERNFGR